MCFIPAWCILLLLFSLPQAKCAVPLNPPSQLLVDWKPSGYTFFLPSHCILILLLLQRFAQGIESRFPTFSWAVTPAEVVWASKYFFYVFMYLCIYVFMYLCIYVFMYLCIYVFMYLCIYVFMYLCIYVFMYLVLKQRRNSNNK